MKYFIKKADGFAELDVEEKNGILVISRQGKEYRVQMEKLGDGRYAFMIDHRPLVVEVEMGKKSLRLVINHRERQVEVLNRRQKIESEIFGAAEAQVTGGDIRAPMPGLILRVEVQPGQAIEAGQPLLVMEAMKMENEIRAPEGGTVKEVLVKPQQAVEKDDVLVKIG